MIYLYILLGLFLASIFTNGMWPALFTAKRLLPAALLGKHNDFPKGFRWIPRRWNAFISIMPPVKLLGTCPKDHQYDIPAPKTWILTWPLHFAWRGRLKLDGTPVPPSFCIRLSLFRYDYNDKYYTFPAGAVKNVRYYEPPDQA